MSKEAALAFATGSPLPAHSAHLPQESAPLQEASSLAGQNLPVAMTQSPVEVEMESSFVAKKLKWEQDRIRKELELKKDRDELKEAKLQLEAFKEKRKTNPIEAIKMLGFTEADYFNFAAENVAPEQTPEEKMIQLANETTEARLKAYEEAQVKQQKELQVQKDQEAMTAFKGELSTHFKANESKYIYSRAMGDDPEGLALAFISEVFKESGGKELIPIEEAFAETENYYKNDWEMKMGKLRPEALKSPEQTFVTPKQEPERKRTITTPEPNHAPKPAITKNRTLNNGATATMASLTQKQESFTEKKERIKADILSGRLERYSK